MNNRPCHAFVALLALLLVPFGVHAQNMSWIKQLAAQGSLLFGPILVSLLMVVALTYFMWGVLLFIARSGDEKAREEGKKKILVGLIGLTILVIVWGLVAFITEIAGVAPNTGVRQTSFCIGGACPD